MPSSKIGVAIVAIASASVVGLLAWGHSVPRSFNHPRVISSPEIVVGSPPGDTASAMSANLVLPEDAIELTSGHFVVADTLGGYIKETIGEEIRVSAGTGSHPSAETLTLNTTQKGLSVLALHPFQDGFLSFSSRGGGVNFHTADGQVRFVGTHYAFEGGHTDISAVKFTSEIDGRVIALNEMGGRNTLIEVTDKGFFPMETPAGLQGKRVAGFAFCGSDLIVSHVIPSGESGNVEFVRYRDGVATSLFIEERHYSNGIYCVGEDDFFYGARWELKRYTKGNISVVRGGFVHIANIRPSFDRSQLLITDSDSEIISLVSFDGAEETVVVSTKGQLLSEPAIKMQTVGTDILAMTPDAALIRYDTQTGEAESLLSPEGDGSWDHFLSGHEFISMRAFVYDDASQKLFIGSNHGIFLLDMQAETFGLYAGSEAEYGRLDGPAKEARFAVIRDLVLKNGTLYVADAWNDMVRGIDLDAGLVTTIMGSGVSEVDDRNPQCATPATQYNLNRPLALTFAGEKLVIVNAHSHSLVALVGEAACIYAGTSKPSLDQYGGAYLEGPTGEGAMNGPIFATYAFGGILVSEMWNNAIRFVDKDGVLSTLYADPNEARMVSGLAVVGNYLYFSGSDSTIKRLRVQF